MSTTTVGPVCLLFGVAGPLQEVRKITLFLNPWWGNGSDDDTVVLQEDVRTGDGKTDTGSIVGLVRS